MINQTEGQEASESQAADKNVPMGYLRAFVTVLVVAHHCVLAYHNDAPSPTQGSWSAGNLLWTAFPVVGPERELAFALFTGINDVYFMSLMFFISGVFVWPSLEHRGALGYIAQRIVRLGLPFLAAALVLAPLAYYPAYLQRGGNPDPLAYANAWWALGEWPAGPAWYLWVLLSFSLVLVLMRAIVPRFGAALAYFSSGAGNRFFLYIAVFTALSAVAYASMNLYLGYDAWLRWGPFHVQGGRIIHYFLYFLAGVGVGAFGWDRGVLDPNGKLARAWWLLPFVGIGAFVALMAAFLTALGMKFEPQLPWTVGLCILFAVSCATLSFALVSLFVRFCTQSNAIADSLGRNAYGIYIVHYAYATWLQFALLDAPLTGLEKGGVVFSVTLVLSWATTALLRSFASVARVI